MGSTDDREVKAWLTRGRIDRTSISQSSPRWFSMSFGSGLMTLELRLNRGLSTIERHFNSAKFRKKARAAFANDRLISPFVFYFYNTSPFCAHSSLNVPFKFKKFK